ncbi:glycoside hydrolase family 18 protein [Pleomassaria siparia CBS 279.74]|uniref:chitinase n=1 Tax=Pleomassaria siparia CBS 279.74 TaxID=1314801 RepID=A0A6G1JSV5_9PLEO|nr:glycoside hydrolase family 18 protein [Pleomassaria siparia CBS 279.74]
MRASFVVLLVLISASCVIGGFNANSKSNVAVYWGQNSVGQADSQDRLSHYCDTVDVDVILLAFLLQINGPGGQPVLNFAGQGDDKKCTRFPGTDLAQCPEIEADIQDCQNKHGKTILLSIGGATYTEGGFPTPANAISAAGKIWSMFGPSDPHDSSTLRPFGHASFDGFDFDFEGHAQNMAVFAHELRRLMDEYTSNSASHRGRRFYLAAAPQCVFPDAYVKEILDSVLLDMVLVQFYNNYCGVQGFLPGSGTQTNYNFATWDSWARETAPNKNVKVFMGVPGGATAGAGYSPPDVLEPVIHFSNKFASFGGAMVWDASQAWRNSGFLGRVKGSMQTGRRTMRSGVRRGEE